MLLPSVQVAATVVVESGGPNELIFGGSVCVAGGPRKVLAVVGRLTVLKRQSCCCCRGCRLVRWLDSRRIVA